MDQLINQLVRDEGEKLTVYKDSKGNDTIGVGHLLTVPITQTAARQILTDDITRIDNELYKGLTWIVQLDEVRRGVLRSLAFNLGVTGLQSFTTFLNLVQQNQWQEAADDLLNTRWASEVGERADRLAKQLITGIWH